MIMHMSTLERRVQLLLDEQQYATVAAEAKQSGRSVNAVIRSAIDMAFGGGADRSAAILDFLDRTSEPAAPTGQTGRNRRPPSTRRPTRTWTPCFVADHFLDASVVLMALGEAGPDRDGCRAFMADAARRRSHP